MTTAAMHNRCVACDAVGAETALVLGRVDGRDQWLCRDVRACLKTRCARLGIVVHCDVCQGEGCVWSSPELRRLSDAWEPSEPPAGEGWQVWETVSEGSPITPVFATPEELARHLSTVGDGGRGVLPSYKQALAFVKAGWAPSGVMIDGVVTTGIAVTAALETSEAAK